MDDMQSDTMNQTGDRAAPSDGMPHARVFRFGTSSSASGRGGGRGPLAWLSFVLAFAIVIGVGFVSLVLLIPVIAILLVIGLIALLVGKIRRGVVGAAEGNQGRRNVRVINREIR